jgi:hypothetical protein
MSAINFFTPVFYKNEPESVRKKIKESLDNYFYLGGEKAVQICGDFVEVESGSTPFIYSALKVATYCTIILPLFALATKAICRSAHQFKQISKCKIEIEPLTNQQAKKLHQDEGFSTLKKLINQIYPVLAKETGSSWFKNHISANILKKLEQSPELLSKLDIEISPKDMQALYDRFGVIALRPLKHNELCVFCGNAPLYSSAMKITYPEGAHAHKGKDTCDADILMHPSVVGAWLTPGLCAYLKTYNSYDLIKGDTMSVVASQSYGEIDEKKLRDIRHLLKTNGTTSFSILPSKWEESKSTIDASAKKWGYTDSIVPKKNNVTSSTGELFQKVVLKKQ